MPHAEQVGLAEQRAEPIQVEAAIQVGVGEQGAGALQANVDVLLDLEAAHAWHGRVRLAHHHGQPRQVVHLGTALLLEQCHQNVHELREEVENARLIAQRVLRRQQEHIVVVTATATATTRWFAVVRHSEGIAVDYSDESQAPQGPTGHVEGRHDLLVHALDPLEVVVRLHELHIGELEQLGEVHAHKVALGLALARAALYLRAQEWIVAEPVAAGLAEQARIDPVALGQVDQERARRNQVVVVQLVVVQDLEFG